MKIIAVDKFNRETIADYLVAENVRSDWYAEIMVDALNKKTGGDNAPWFYRAVPDDHRLSRGMEDLV